MRRSLLALALCSSALATPAFARDDSVYIEADAGAVLASTNRYRLPSGGSAGRLETKTGFDAGGIIGYDTGFLRLEVEGSYRRVKNAFESLLPKQRCHFSVHFGMKSNYSVPLLRALCEDGCGFDCVSANEARKAMLCGANPDGHLLRT